ncbi:MAG: T9SS type A sorting domain-containing protein [candidate division WOR-3 bacterium]
MSKSLAALFLSSGLVFNTLSFAREIDFVLTVKNGNLKRTIDEIVVFPEFTRDLLIIPDSVFIPNLYPDEMRECKFKVFGNTENRKVRFTIRIQKKTWKKEISLNTKSSQEMEMVPQFLVVNPDLFHFIVYYHLPFSQKASLKIFDVCGRKIDEYKYSSTKEGVITISTKGLAQGVYFLLFTSPSFVKSEKIVVIR